MSNFIFENWRAGIGGAWLVCSAAAWAAGTQGAPPIELRTGPSIPWSSAEDQRILNELDHRYLECVVTSGTAGDCYDRWFDACRYALGTFYCEQLENQEDQQEEKEESANSC